MRLLVKICFTVLAFSWMTQVQAESRAFQVLPWNGYKAATSLTFDDGDPIHLDVVIPEMNKRHLNGTFYLIADKLERVEEWKKAALAGHELGNHTLDHKHTSEFKPGDAQKQVVEAKSILEKDLGVPIYSFAYPYTENTPELLKFVEANHFIARNGFGNPYLEPNSNPDWFNIPSSATMTDTDFAVYQNWIDQDLYKGAWNVWMIHGVEGSNMWQPIPKKVFLQVLDYLVKKKKELWVAPFATVGAYWKAQKILEESKPIQDGKTIVWKWEKPVLFPPNVVLKVKIEGKVIQVSQAGKSLKPLSPGVYGVSFDTLELTVKNSPWKVDDLSADLPPSTSVMDKPSAQTPDAAPALLSALPPAGNIFKVDDFEADQPTYGSPWWEGCDSNKTGTTLSPVPFARLKGGSPQSPGYCAGLKGRLGSGQNPWPWAALAIDLQSHGHPLDLTAYKSIRFYTQGDGKTHSIVINRAAVTDFCDYQTTFISPTQWTKITIPLADFAQPAWGAQVKKGFTDVTKLTFTPGNPGADYDFKIDDVEFVK